MKSSPLTRPIPTKRAGPPPYNTTYRTFNLERTRFFFFLFSTNIIFIYATCRFATQIWKPLTWGLFVHKYSPAWIKYKYPTSFNIIVITYYIEGSWIFVFNSNNAICYIITNIAVFVGTILTRYSVKPGSHARISIMTEQKAKQRNEVKPATSGSS